MRLLLSVVFIEFIFLSNGQSDLAEGDYPFSEDNETLFTRNHAYGRDLDVELTTNVLQDIPANSEGDEVKTENENSDVCGSPSIIEFTKIDRKKKAPYAIGTEIVYSCDFGYAADGASHTSVCTQASDGGKPFWSDPQIVCIPRSCGDPGYVLNARRVGSRFTFPNSVSFECDIGYVLKGTGVRYCQVNGRWSGSLPSCEEVFCDKPETPINGRVSHFSLEYRSKLKYECDSGYLLKNHPQPRVCTENGTWSGPEPICQEAQCDPPVAPDNGFVEVVGKPRIGSIALYSCAPGRRLVGSGTSKCMDNGEWMFDPPKCIDPCNVPNVPNGHIGKYEGRTRQKYFTELTIGTTTGDQDELFLRCSEGYEPLGENKNEIKVECKQGIWKNEPVCKPAKCRGNPPPMENGKPRKPINRDYGNYVVYDCAQYTTKTKYGNVTCRFGQWQGVPPICTDERCFIDTIPFPGLVKPIKSIYFTNEYFRPVCEKGYDVVDPQNKLTCQTGKWEGTLPPCSAASCLSFPPSILNGKIKSYSKRHSSLVYYECEKGYVLQGSSQVQCLFGEWKNDAPVCKDSHCYFKDLKFRDGMMIPSRNPVSNGETIDVKCAKGFYPRNVKPICSRGTWNEYEISPCQPGDCSVTRFQNGALTKKVTTKKYLGLKTVTTYEMENIGSRYKDGHSLFVSCYKSYYFQGKNMGNHVPITCVRGIWKPSPVCLRYGAHYEEEEEEISTQLPLVEVPELSSTTAGPIAQPRQALPTVPPQEENISPIETTERKSLKDEDCFCIYKGSDDLIAFAGQERLQFETKVKSNCTVKFYCAYFGYHHLRGPKEIKCENCRTWDLSEYPGCVPPQRGDTILGIDPSFHLRPDGVLEVEQGLSPQIECYGNEIHWYPVWISNVHNSRWSVERHYYVDGRRSKFLVFHNIGSRHNGLYSCGINGYEGRTIEIQVKPLCEEFYENAEYRVHYERGQNVGSNVVFTCKNPKKKPNGPGVLMCMPNGEWSGKPPKCTISCPALNESEGMRIEYGNALNVGSVASFHCLVPRVRKGVAFINCLSNGEWSRTMPSCTLQNCPVDGINENLPEDAVPNLEGIDPAMLEVPPGFEVPLACEGNLRLSNTFPVKCGENGLWVVPPVRCLQGCYFVETSPGLILEPKKDFYKLGEIVALSCGPGQVLSSQVEILMCLRDDWSEEIPSCKDAQLPMTIIEKTTQIPDHD